MELTERKPFSSNLAVWSRDDIVFAFVIVTTNFCSWVYIYSATDAVAAQQTQQVQQILLALGNSPYGDSPLFRNIKTDSAKREELLKPTNPAAQRDALKSSQYKVSPRPASKIKLKPLHSILNGKVCCQNKVAGVWLTCVAPHQCMQTD